MAAPIGNRFWEQRSSHGRKPIFEDPEQLWEAACEYFEWVTDNPLEEAKAFAYEGVVTVEDLPKMRAMTIQGLCFFLDISDETWATYCSKEGFIGICSDIKGLSSLKSLKVQVLDCLMLLLLPVSLA